MAPFQALWLLAGLRQYPRRLSRLQTSTLKLPALRHQKINLNRKGRRANSVVKPIFGVSANFALQIAALALCGFASSCRRPAKPEPNPADYTSTQRSARHVWRCRPMGLHSSCNIGQEKTTWPAGAPTTTQLKMTYSAFGETAARLRSVIRFTAVCVSSVFSSQRPHNPRLQPTCPSRRKNAALRPSG